ncbi:MAG TPA: DUF2752 domain-containing protein [Actinoallomurus sp.]|nr:DUF2752 domain-containing protein [Actinoallomurus sp.]
MTTVRTWRGCRSRWAPYAVLGVVAGAAGYVALVDPNHAGHYPTCPFYAVTGYYCPGCGSLRMIHALAHGHVAEAFGRNPLAFVTLPILGYLWARWTVAARRGRPLQAKILQPWAIIVFAVVIVVFWVLRNLPAGHALAP